MKKTQRQIVLNELITNCYVSRNWCLQNFISRLGAIIFDLKKEGWEIEGKWHYTEHGKDFRYYLKKRPEQLLFV